MQGNTWVLVADAAKARIYAAYKAKLFMTDANEKDLKLIHVCEHPASQKRGRDLVTDNSGRYRSMMHSDTFDGPTDPKKYEEDRFALQLFKFLHSACHNNQFEELILIASPAFMGMLNKHIAHDDMLQRLISVKIEKDYMECNERELVKHLQTHL